MKHLNKKQERGALLVEIMAVIALLGVMGPLLFKQVSERNEEVDNINIATEIRAVKEAFASYILAYHSELAATGIMEDTSRQITEKEADEIVTFLPEGYDNVLGHYNLYIHRKTTTVNSNQFQGFIAPNMESLGLSGLTLRRVARIANLIGADGGLVMAGSDEINGTGGAWHASTDVIGGSSGGHVFVATTGLDTFVPEVVLEDFDQRNIQMPENLAFKRLHAYEYFSVDPGNSNNCYTNAITTTTGAMASDDTIKRAGENNCEPLFWVIASDPNTDPDTDSATKNNDRGFVFLKNQLHLRSHPTGISDIVLATSGSIDDDSPAQILVRGADGKTRVKISGDSSIISLSSKNDEDSIGLQNGMLVTDKDASLARETTGIDGLTFKVDPARVSVMGDIRLEAMGGAKLSELLPKFNLQKVEIFTNTSYTIVDMPTCPNHYYPAIVVTPASLTFPTERAILSAVEDNVIWDETTSSLIDETGKTATINDLHIYPTIVIEREKSSWSNNFVDIENANKEGRWEISVAYSNDKDDDYFTPQPISIVVQTYCVFDSSGGLGSGMYTTTDEETRNEKAKIK